MFVKNNMFLEVDNKMTKKVLMTNLYLQKYTGSELHTLEIARQFKKHGFEVTIMVYSKAYPLLALCNDFKVIECKHERLDEQYYDIVFLQHFPVYDYLHSQYSIKYRYLIVSKLSLFNEYELLPECYDKADLISVVSEECADAIRAYTNNIFLFQNSVENRFFESFPLKLRSKMLKKICIISNHVPKELYEIKNIMQEYNISYIGAGNEIKLVSPEVLQEFDLVITIGRTVQQCFACGVPVFVYDYFGGPGYINSNNLELAKAHNFSGRGFTKMDALKIKKEIISGYPKNFENLKSLMLYTKKNFNLDDVFNNMLEKVTKNPKPISYLPQLSDLERLRFSLYTRLISLDAYLSETYCQKSQLYIDYGNDFNEDDSIVWNICSSYPIEQTLDLRAGVKKIRFDPTSIPCKCKLTKVLINGEDITKKCIPLNSSYSIKDEYFFANYDPQFLIEFEDVTTISLSYSYEPLNIQDYNKIESIWLNSNKELRKEVKLLTREVQELNLKLHPLKRIYNKIKNKA